MDNNEDPAVLTVYQLRCWQGSKLCYHEKNLSIHSGNGYSYIFDWDSQHKLINLNVKSGKQLIMTTSFRDPVGLVTFLDQSVGKLEALQFMDWYKIV